MLTSAGGTPILPYWFHRSVSTVGVGHRRMYTPTHQINKVTNPHESGQSTAPPKCETCLSFDKTKVFFPCKYIFCCELCSVKINICPVCREEIVEKIKIYY